MTPIKKRNQPPTPSSSSLDISQWVYDWDQNIDMLSASEMAQLLETNLATHMRRPDASSSPAADGGGSDAQQDMLKLREEAKQIQAMLDETTRKMNDLLADSKSRIQHNEDRIVELLDDRSPFLSLNHQVLRHVMSYCDEAALLQCSTASDTLSGRVILDYHWMDLYKRRNPKKIGSTSGKLARTSGKEFGRDSFEVQRFEALAETHYDYSERQRPNEVSLRSSSYANKDETPQFRPVPGLQETFDTAWRTRPMFTVRLSRVDLLRSNRPICIWEGDILSHEVHSEFSRLTNNSIHRYSFCIALWEYRHQMKWPELHEHLEKGTTTTTTLSDGEKMKRLENLCRDLRVTIVSWSKLLVATGGLGHQVGTDTKQYLQSRNVDVNCRSLRMGSTPENNVLETCIELGNGVFDMTVGVIEDATLRRWDNNNNDDDSLASSDANADPGEVSFFRGQGRR